MDDAKRHSFAERHDVLIILGRSVRYINDYSSLLRNFINYVHKDGEHTHDQMLSLAGLTKHALTKYSYNSIFFLHYII